MSDPFKHLLALVRERGLKPDDAKPLEEREDRKGQLPNDTQPEENANTDESVPDGSYVLVSVDMHSHPFCKSPSSIKQYMKSAVEQALTKLVPNTKLSSLRIDARAYAGARLDKTMESALYTAMDSPSAKVKLEFSSIKNHAKINWIQSIADACLHSIQNNKCTNIFLAAWNHPIYLSMLQLNAPKIVLVEGKTMGQGIQALLPSDRMAQFPEVFSMSPRKDRLADDYISRRVYHPLGSLVGVCKLDPSLCSEGRCGSPHTTNTTKTTTAAVDVYVPEPWKAGLRVAGSLPQHRQARPGHIAVNMNGERLDCYVRRPSSEVREELLTMLSRDCKPCWWHHLTEACTHGDDCIFDHTELSNELLLAMNGW
ncbi:hypothetical protein EK21DRAFT_116419 [Setomelanomma holmii]|uniref:C3H1-type domain-containing protein n=1 Tax=Setomelanomma holmii TaxID=210430 RepID=A0A9P4LJ97_9PLEO|nr:hypothetical protein EK21DRAFT_116419 [Setomelanomma holmii]